MTVKQKQCLLAYLGYYVGEIDGDWAILSKTATKAFQLDHNLVSDGVFGDATAKAAKAAVVNDRFKTESKPDATVNNVGDKFLPTGTFWDEIEYFTRDEFKCKCGGRYCNGYPAEPKETMVRIADQLRRNLGVPITVVSGLRCERWNAIQGGVANSQHMYGEAMDIWAQGKSQSTVEAELDRIGGVRYHYPIDGSSNVHFDIPKGAR